MRDLLTRQSSHSPLSREAALLRLLARLEFVAERHLHLLLAPHLSRRHYRRILKAAHDQRLIWRLPVDPNRLPGAMGASNQTPPPCTPMLYGLTAQGRAWLDAEGVEDDPAVLDRAIVRDWRKPELKLGQLAHDLLVIDWCCRALAALRTSPLTRMVEVVLEYVSAASPTGTALQRIDALMLVQVDPSRSGQPAPPATAPIPWGWPARNTPGTVAWALELDRGTEILVTLLGKAVMYRDLTVSGHYADTLGCPVLPVVVTPTARRAAQIAREWLDGWPDGRGVVSYQGVLRDQRGGVLWGRYKTMGVNPARDATLWDDLGIAQADWEPPISH
ncbi:MAG: replication-relaxation family protein [Oscillochloridaceae bacterium umkhey_bin13]